MLIKRPLLTRPDIAEIRRQVRAMRTPPDPVVYRPCPRCKQPMSRRNFGRMSGVVLDECVQHGIWLDETELDRIQQFVSVGGLELQ